MNRQPATAPARSVRRFAGAVLGALAASALLAGCGNNVPSDSVARVGDAVIKKSEFDHWLSTIARGQAPPGASGAPAVPDPPSFTQCVANLKKQPLPKGPPPRKDADLKNQCKQQYEGMKDQVLQFLITAEWLLQEAEERDLKVSDAEVRKQFDDQKKQSFPKEKDYQAFLKQSGTTEADLIFRVKLDALTNKIRQDVVEGKGEVNDDDIKKYYEQNKTQFSQPERRDLRVVLTKNEAKANEAKEAIEGGQGFARVAKRLSIDEASKSQGGKLPAVAKGQQEAALDAAVFKAPKGKLTGPVKTQFGYYVFEVTKVAPASQQSLEQAKETIRNIVKSQKEQKALDEFSEDFRKKYTDATKCAKGFIVEVCGNAPKPKTDSGPASGGAPQGAPTPGAPPPTPGAPPGAPPGAVPQQGAPPQGAPPQGAPPQGAPPQGAPPQGGPPPGPPPAGAPER